MAHEPLDYLIVLPIESRVFSATKGEQLPGHCTVMPWFQMALKPVIKAAVESCGITDGIELVSERRGYFGPENTIPVHVLASNPLLKNLHERLGRLLGRQSWTPRSREWIGPGYVPHVSDVEGWSFPPGSRYIATQLLLIQRNADGEREVAETFSLMH